MPCFVLLPFDSFSGKKNLSLSHVIASAATALGSCSHQQTFVRFSAANNSNILTVQHHHTSSKLEQKQLFLQRAKPYQHGVSVQTLESRAKKPPCLFRHPRKDRH